MDAARILKHLELPTPMPAQDDALPSGSVSLDIILGGGWPAGQISELCGPPGYAEPVAYRTVAACQRAYPGSLAVFCGGDFSIRRASQAGLDTRRLLVTRSQDAAVQALGADQPPRLAVIDATLDTDMPVRADKTLTVLCLTRRPGDVRSTACVEMRSYGGAPGWAWAERMWHTWHPSRLGISTLPACLGSHAHAQEILSIAITLGVITRRGRWYSYGSLRLGSGWKEAARAVDADPALRAQILTRIAGCAVIHPEWPQAYA